MRKRSIKVFLVRRRVVAVLAALARQAVGAGLTARGLPDEMPPDAQEKTVTKKAKN